MTEINRGYFESQTRRYTSEDCEVRMFYDYDCDNTTKRQKFSLVSNIETIKKLSFSREENKRIVIILLFKLMCT